LILVPLFPARSQSVAGQITQRPSGSSVAGVRLVLLDTNGSLKAAVVSDSVGRYAVQAPASGKYRMLAVAPGFDAVKVPEMFLEQGRTMTLDIKLSPAIAATATQLEKVTISAERPVVSAPRSNPHKYDEFLMRRKMGIGTFLTREQIEAKPVSQTPQIFSQIAGLKVRQHGTEWYIQSQRCPARLGDGRQDEDMEQDNPSLYPILFVDGFRVRGLKFLTSISPTQIEAIEVYQGAAQLPADAKGNACAAIYVWLRSGN
jgi:hypothetical protein